MSDIIIAERGTRSSCLGVILQLKIFTRDYRPLGWREVWEAFTTAYPNKWAVQFFPPANELVDGKSVYHLFVMDGEPSGLNLR